MSEWRKGVLSDIAIITMGQSPKGETCNNDGNGLPLLNGPTEFGLSHPIPTQFTEDPKRIAEIGDVLFCVRGSTTGRMNWANQKYAIGRGIASIRYKSNQYNSFIYHLLNYRLPYLLGIATGSTFPNVSKDHLNELPVNIPDNANMEIINSILFNLDQKINLLHQQNQTLEELAQTLFKRWFVDFEFPNENGEPYKSSGGKMIASELGEIPEGWEISTIGDITINHDKLRKPLSKNQRLKKQGVYPYHGATSIMDFVDDYIFDGKYLLLGEDGSVVDENGYPYLQYVKGKFWVNNHAHVLEGKGSITTDYLYLLLSKTNISNIVTGAVQLKINQGNLNSIEVILPSKTVLESFNLLMSPIFSKIFNQKTEIQSLTKLRDTLLPKLMNGELKIN